MENLENFIDRLDVCFHNRKFADLRITLLDMEPYDIAIYMEENLDEKEFIVFFRLLPKELASDVFVEFEIENQENLIKSFTDKELKEVVDDLYLDDAVDIIEEMPANVVKRILKATSAENRKQINKLLEYPDDSAGSIMTTEYVSFSKNITVEQAFDKIRRTGLNKETIYTCYVTDSKKHLLGVVTVKDLLLAEKDATIESIMDSAVITVNTLFDQEQVALMFGQYDFIALPVIDTEGCIVGIITVDDVVDVIREEATEDIQKMAAILPSEKTYLRTNPFDIWKQRLPWLLLLMISATFTSMILSSYETKLAVIAGGALYAFVPMLMGTAGNAGSQAAVTVTRAIAVGEIEPKDAFKILLKELFASFLLGLTVAIACFLKVNFIDCLYNDGITPKLALIVSGVLLLTIMLAKIVGCLLPIIAKKIRLDPAVVASPFITTIIDVLSLVIYCNIASLILG